MIPIVIMAIEDESDRDYVPFSLSDDFRLVGANEQTKAKYLEYYDRIHLKDRMRSIFYQYYKYGNVFCYLMEDGNIITLPVHLVRIANVMIGGEPVLEFNCKSVRDDMRQQGVKAQKDFLEDEDLKVRLEGFPKEVSDAINKGSQYMKDSGTEYWEIPYLPIDPLDVESGEHLRDARAEGGLDALCRAHGGDLSGGVPPQSIDRAIRIGSAESGRAFLCSCGLWRQQIGRYAGYYAAQCSQQPVQESHDRRGTGDHQSSVQSGGHSA